MDVVITTFEHYSEFNDSFISEISRITNGTYGEIAACFLSPN